jgi:hypothetical protein
MNPKPEKPLRLFVNPLAIWTDLAFKTGQALWASAHAAAVRANTTARVAVIPTDDAPGGAAKPVRRASKAVRFKATRAKLRSKANGKRRARR